MIKPVLYDELRFDLEDYGIELIKEAFKPAALKNARSYSLVQRILKDWKQSGVKTIAEAKAESEHFDSNPRYTPKRSGGRI